MYKNYLSKATKAVISQKKKNNLNIRKIERKE